MERSRSNASDLFARALRILGRRDHSEAELRQKLERVGAIPAAIDEVIERCTSYNYLNDVRYAEVKSREMLRNGRGVGPRILLELRRRGIKESLAHAALISAAQEIPAEEVFRQQLQRRFAGFNYAAASDKERRRVVSYFQRRGFDLGTIFTLLKNNPPPDNN